MADEVALPPLPSPSAGPDELREALRALILWAQARDPLGDGAGLDKFLTGTAALSAGLLTYSPGAGVSGGTAGGAYLPGPATSNPSDASPPTPITGLSVAAGVAHNLVQWSAPTYTQGGGNGRTIIYAANYSGAGPLPTFQNAVEVGTTPGRGTILVVDAEPGVQVHYWAKAETRHPTLQASPTGGLNGVTSTADLIEDQHIVNLSVAKLIAGAIGVSEYIESTGYVAGSAGWHIDGDGSAEFANVTIRGTIYATAGSIGGILIDSKSIRSTNFDGSFDSAGALVSAGTAGWGMSKAGSLVVDVAHTRDSKQMASTVGTYLHSGSTVSTKAAEQLFASHVGNNFALRAGCNGYLELYLDTASAVLAIVSYTIVARETTTLVERSGPTVFESHTLESGQPWTPTSAYRYFLPFTLEWLFAGKYWRSTPALPPGTAGSPASPTQENNFLGTGTWNIYVAVNIELYSPGTSTSASNLTNVRIALGGWAQSTPGSVAYDAASPLI